jgi:hypothetical protein
MPITVEQIVREVQTLSAEDLRRVREEVESILETKENRRESIEAEFLKELESEGFIGKIPPPITDFSRYHNFQPVTVTGEPVSEMIIRERR